MKRKNWEKTPIGLQKQISRVQLSNDLAKTKGKQHVKKIAIKLRKIKEIFQIEAFKTLCFFQSMKFWVGLFSKIVSTISMVFRSNFLAAAKHLKFSSSWEGFLPPNIRVDTFLFFKQKARAKSTMLHPALSATYDDFNAYLRGCPALPKRKAEHKIFSSQKGTEVSWYFDKSCVENAWFFFSSPILQNQTSERASFCD